MGDKVKNETRVTVKVRVWKKTTDRSHVQHSIHVGALFRYRKKISIQPFQYQNMDRVLVMSSFYDL
jgi:hypothetical protein